MPAPKAVLRKRYQAKGGFTGAITRYGRLSGAPVAIVWTPIMPKPRFINFGGLTFVAEGIAKEIANDLKATSETWRHPVNWQLNSKKGAGHIYYGGNWKTGVPGNLEIRIFNTSAIWNFVDKGTKGTGVWLVKYKSKTDPGKFASGPGGMDNPQTKKIYLTTLNRARSAAGKKVAQRHQRIAESLAGVGITPRDWTKIIVESYGGERGDLKAAADEYIQKVLGR